MPVIAPSILAANFLRLGEAIEMINQSEAQWIHCDVMDGKFVPNISFGMPVLEAVKTASRKVMDVHLMIVEPERYLQTFKNCGADVLTIHQEACTHLHRTLQAIRDLGMKAGVALNPSTPISTLEEVLPLIDVVCLMSVNPGFGGQKFISSVIDKTFRLKQLIEKAGTKTLIEIDGGVNISNAPTLIQAGAEVLVAGNFVFSAPDPIDIIAQMASIKPVINA
ncbi:MAG: ribulose-phosphate 3-epimerase [Bacteroidia bacterium]|nr:ribulose-phosphate 3-epimerase [Bacteroidia bacterium]